VVGWEGQAAGTNARDAPGENAQPSRVAHGMIDLDMDGARTEAFV
jgi:hypothetical protein